MILILTPSFFSCESALVTQSCLNTLPQLINDGVRIKIIIDATLKQNKTKQNKTGLLERLLHICSGIGG